MKTTASESEAIRGFASPLVCRLLEVPPSTLGKWASDGLVAATLLDTTGRRSTRYWTPEDFVLVRLVKALRDSGCEYQVIARARSVLDEAWGSLGHDDHFYWDGHDLIEVTEWGEVQSRLQQPGQLMMHYVATPLQLWLGNAMETATLYDRADYERLKTRRQATTSSRSSATSG